MDAPLATDCPPGSFNATSGSGEKILWDQVIWTPIQAEDPTAGTAYELTAGGIISTRSTSPGTLQWVMRLGTDTATAANNKSAGASTAINLTASLVDVPWHARAVFWMRSGGLGAAACSSYGAMFLGNLTTTAASTWVFGSNSITNCDFTVNQALVFDCNFSQATTSTCTAQWCFLRRLN